MTEVDLIHGIRSGSEDAFRLLTDTYQKKVFNVCHSVVHNVHDADDLTQEVFIEVFRSAGHFRGESRLSTWLYRIAVNKSLNHLRRRKRKEWLRYFNEFTRGPKPEDINPTDPGLASDDLENRQRQQRLHQAIDALPENQRTAFLLNKYEELSYRQIADIMELSLSAVESLIHRARLNLQKKLWNSFKNSSL